MKMRKITVEGREYGWRVGSGAVAIRTSEGKGFYPSLLDVAGPEWDWNSIERGHWKGYFSIRPIAIENYIRRVVLGQPIAPPTYYDCCPSRVGRSVVGTTAAATVAA